MKVQGSSRLPGVAALPALTPGQARRLQLSAQGLLQPPGRRARPADVVAAIARMRLLQIDSIHVVARSPYLVLHSRLGDYPPHWLDEALEQGHIAECWAHEACFVPAADLPLHRAWRERGGHWAHRHAARMHAEHQLQMAALLARIREHGPVRAADFPRADRGASGWWEWKPEKRWLEAWFALGELMIPRRERFQRVYDLAERVLPRLDPPFVASALSPAQLRERFVLDSVRALGITQARWIADYYRLKPAVSDAELAAWVDAGVLLSVTVRGWDAPAYVHRDHRERLCQARAGQLRATHTALLSPFDPLVWDRSRVATAFGFEYTIECYTPAPKRRYGYYVLPILHRGDVVGRLDAKAHRDEGLFAVNALYLEPGQPVTARLVAELGQAVSRTARWHATPRVSIDRSEPAGLARALRAYWAGQA